jgi:Helix-turn-helix domain
MASPIIAAVRRRTDLKESVQHTLQELAHIASVYGIARVSYDYLARKAHCSRRTAIRHIQKLIDAKIIRKTVLWIRGDFCEINTYKFIIAWDKRSVRGGSDKLAPTLPLRERGKEISVRVELDNQRKALRLGYVTPGSVAWESAQEKITYLEGLLAQRE